MYAIQKDTATRPLLFMMVDDTDHIAGKTGLTPSVTISKNGATFAAPAGAISEVGNGWYQVAANATDSNTLGVLVLHATATTADPTDVQYEIVGYDPTEAWASHVTTDKIETMLEQDGEAYRYTQNALENAPGASSIGNGGGITIGDNDGGFVAVDIAGPDTIDFTMVRGDDYTDESTTPLEFHGTGWVDLSATGTTVTMTVRKKAGDTIAFSIAGTVVTAGGTGVEQVVKFEPSAVETNGLLVGSSVYKYDIQANIPSTPTAQIKTLVLGNITVLEDQTRPA